MGDKKIKTSITATKTPEEAIKMVSHVISTNIVLKIVDY